MSLRRIWLLTAIACLVASCDRPGSASTGVCYDTWDEVHWEWKEAGCAYRARCDSDLNDPERFYDTCMGSGQYLHVGFIIDGCVDGCRALDCITALRDSDCQYPNTVQECWDAIGWLEDFAPPESEERTCRRPVEK